MPEVENYDYELEVASPGYASRIKHIKIQTGVVQNMTVVWEEMPVPTTE